MKSLKLFFIVIIIIFVTGLLIILAVSNSKESFVEDTVYPNELSYQIKENWNKWNNIDLYKIGMDYIVYDQNGVELYRSGNHKAGNTIESSIKDHYIIIPIDVDERFVGTLAIKSSLDKQIEGYRNRVILSIVLFCVIVSLVLCLFLTRLYRQVFLPFKKLETFASQIAYGNLEIPLNKDRYNTFGAFSESFDLMREQLKKARDDEYNANLSKKELIASLSHDIKTPVTSIQLISEMLLLTEKDKDKIEKFRIIYEKTNQIDLLITDMFNVTLKELEEFEINVKELDSTIFHKVIRAADYKNMVSTIEVKECLFYADPLRLSQIIGNVISNSYKYANTKIEITTSIQHDSLILKIKDFGPGVAVDDLPFIFDKFFRGNSTTVKNQAGAGLGLYISKCLMERMNGNIDYECHPDGFAINLMFSLIG